MHNSGKCNQKVRPRRTFIALPRPQILFLDSFIKYTLIFGAFQENNKKAKQMKYFLKNFSFNYKKLIAILNRNFNKVLQIRNIKCYNSVMQTLV